MMARNKNGCKNRQLARALMLSSLIEADDLFPLLFLSLS